MNQTETKAELSDPKLKACGWGVVEGSKVLRAYRISAGNIQTAEVWKLHISVSDSFQAVFFNINCFQDSTIENDGGWGMNPTSDGRIAVFSLYSLFLSTIQG